MLRIDNQLLVLTMKKPVNFRLFATDVMAKWGEYSRIYL